MPVEPFDILMAKVKNHIYICMPIVIFFGIAANIALPISPAIRAAVVIIPGIIRSSYGPAWRDMQSSHAEV